MIEWMWRLSGRSIRPELLESAGSEAAASNLRDLVRINRWFGAHAILSRLVAECVEPGERLAVVDIGAASGDMGASLAARFPNLRITSLDRHIRHLAAARPPKLVADAFRLPFADSSFDLVVCSLFLHHFNDDDVVTLLERFHRLSRRALIVLDIERHPLAARFLPATRRLFGWHDLTVNDGRASVEAAFSPAELAALALRARLASTRVRRHRPWFRLSLVARRTAIVEK